MQITDASLFAQKHGVEVKDEVNLANLINHLVYTGPDRPVTTRHTLGLLEPYLKEFAMIIPISAQPFVRSQGTVVSTFFPDIPVIPAGVGIGKRRSLEMFKDGLSKWIYAAVNRK